MKKILMVLAWLFALTMNSQEKIYYTKEFKELPNAKDAIYYSTYEKHDQGTNRVTYYIDGTLRNSDQFSNVRKKILDGSSINWYKNGAKKSVFLFVKGKQDGIQTRYFESGQIKRTEVYQKGEFIEGKCYEENGKEIPFFPYTVKAEFPGGMKEFYKYVGKNFKRVNSAKGLIKVSFVVTVDGALRDFKIIEGLNYDMNVEALRVLFESPAWIPGKVDGIPSPTEFSIPITVK